MLQGGAVPQANLLRPIRPGLGSRSTSNASIGNNFHKRAADFDLGEILGEGSYSTVFLATDKFPPHRQYALKVLDKPGLGVELDQDRIDFFRRDRDGTRTHSFPGKS